VKAVTAGSVRSGLVFDRAEVWFWTPTEGAARVWVSTLRRARCRVFSRDVLFCRLTAEGRGLRESFRVSSLVYLLQRKRAVGVIRYYPVVDFGYLQRKRAVREFFIFRPVVSFTAETCGRGERCDL
jgi:hypothetical protein